MATKPGIAAAACGQFVVVFSYWLLSGLFVFFFFYRDSTFRDGRTLKKYLITNITEMPPCNHQRVHRRHVYKM